MPVFHVVYEDWEGDKGMTIEAPCFGVAVDMYLASRGMFGYNKITYSQTNEAPEVCLSELLKYYPLSLNPDEIERFNKHHKHATEKK